MDDQPVKIIKDCHYVTVDVAKSECGFIEYNNDVTILIYVAYDDINILITSQRQVAL